MNAKVNILLSTYNGARYLQAQLDSLYAQTYANCSIYVRDDGSSDATLNILENAQNHGLLYVLPSNSNLGPANSFFTLLEQSPEDSGFFAFCDQDDIWMPEKVQSAVNAIVQISEKIPVVYCSRVTYVDEDNQFIKLAPMPRKIGFGNALVENIATGCTVVMNKAARELIVKNLPERCIMHDSWCYLLISCMGKLIYDPVPNMNYRQHAANTIGASTSVLQTIFRRFKRFSMRKNGLFRFSNQAESFLTLYQNTIPAHQVQLLSKFVGAKHSFAKRLLLALSPQIWRQTLIDNMLLRVLILLNRY